MSHINSNFDSAQLFDVLAYGANGELIATVCESAMLSGALSAARGYNERNGRSVAVVVEHVEQYESNLIELSESDFAQSRECETASTACLWDWLREGVDDEVVDVSALEKSCYGLMRIALASSGRSVPAAFEFDDDGAILCSRLTVAEQFSIWQQLMKSF